MELRKSLEATAEGSESSMRLIDLYSEELPDESEQIWSFLGLKDFYEDLPIIEIDPGEWVREPNYDGKTLLQIFKKKASWALQQKVQDYRRMISKGKEIDPIVVSSALGIVIDGQHRIIAASFEDLDSIEAVDIS